MKILINIHPLLKDAAAGHSCFVQEAVNEMIIKNSDHQFLILGDQKNTRYFSSAFANLPVKKTAARHPLLWKWWHDIKLPSLLKKHGIDVYVSFSGFCSLATAVPQCLLLHGLSFFFDTSPPKKYPLFFYKRFLPKFLHKAAVIAGPSSFLINGIARQYAVRPEKMIVVPICHNEAPPALTEGEKQAARDRYSDGKNYFLYMGKNDSSQNLITLLKAFSIFKKRQKSNWKLVVLSNPDQAKRFIGTLKAYKYRDDVELVDTITGKELAGLMRSAYSFLASFYRDERDTTLLTAMQAGTAVICPDHPALKETGADAALYADFTDEKDIADKMMLLYKDESLRNRLADKAASLAAAYTPGNTADFLWQAILKAVKEGAKALP